MLTIISEGDIEQQQGQFLQNEIDLGLSEKGKNQAHQTGQAFKQIFNEHINSQSLNPDDLVLIFMSSPYFRCLETLAILMQYIPIEKKKKKIYIQNELSDLQLPHFYKEQPQKEKFRINYDKNLQGYFNKQYGIEILKKQYLKEIKIQPQYPEDQSYCRARIGSFLMRVQSHADIFDNKKNHIYICATHIGVQDIVLDHFDGKNKNIDYCSLTMINFPQSWKNPKLILRAKQFWK